MLPHRTFTGVFLCPPKQGGCMSNFDGKTLAQISKKDKPWDRHRKNAMLVQDTYDTSGLAQFARYAERMSECANTLLFAATEENKIKLAKTHFCRVRHCPVCSWRRTLALLARFYQSFPAFAEENPNMRFVYCVLTVRNPEMGDLRSTLSAMTKAWAKMRKRKAFGFVKGWVRTTEITHGKDGNPHPHFNLLLAVDKNYFTSKDYLNKQKWIELWKSCAQLDYEPSVYVTKVRKKKGSADGEAVSCMDAAKEIFKYSVKEEDLTESPTFLLGITREVQGLRFFAAGGCFKDLSQVDEDGNGSEVSEEEMALSGDNSDEPVTTTRFMFAWEQRKHWSYWYRGIYKLDEKRGILFQESDDSS